MKKIIFLTLMLASILLVSCEYDNYDAPSLSLSGRLTYNGQAFPYDGNAARGVLRVYQTGFGKVDGGTPVQVGIDGSFNQVLFSGNYWLSPENHQYPFEFVQFKNLGAGLGYDSLRIDLQKNHEMNIEVIPYYEVKDYQVSVSNGNIVMSFKVNQTSGTVNKAPKIVRARCYIGTATIVNSQTTCTAAKDLNMTDSGNIEISMPVSSYKNGYINNFRTYAFCRVAIELENIPNYYLFSEVKKLEGIPQ